MGLERCLRLSLSAQQPQPLSRSGCPVEAIRGKSSADNRWSIVAVVTPPAFRRDVTAFLRGKTKCPRLLRSCEDSGARESPSRRRFVGGFADERGIPSISWRLTAEGRELGPVDPQYSGWPISLYFNFVGHTCALLHGRRRRLPKNRRPIATDDSLNHDGTVRGNFSDVKMVLVFPPKLNASRRPPCHSLRALAWLQENLLPHTSRCRPR